MSFTVLRGSTNSGKTFFSVNWLLDQGSGVYVGPLKLLVFEVYEKMKALVGSERVGIDTGDIRENVRADFLCCTTEKAPLDRINLVIDEVHWMWLEKERGHYWTNLLLQGNYENVCVCSPLCNVEGFEPLIHDRVLRVINLERRGSLVFVEDGKSVEQIAETSSEENKIAFVCFSRKSVINLWVKLSKKHTCSYLYGKMSLADKNGQVEDFRGSNNILITTDVIGHGLNLPIDTAVIVEGKKFDGFENRLLTDWEMSQIIGRAGRGAKTGFIRSVCDYDLRAPLSIAKGTTESIMGKFFLAPRASEIFSGNVEKNLRTWETENELMFEIFDPAYSKITEIYEKMTSLGKYNEQLATRIYSSSIELRHLSLCLGDIQRDPLIGLSREDIEDKISFYRSCKIMKEILGDRKGAKESMQITEDLKKELKTAEFRPREFSIENLEGLQELLGEFF